MPGVITEMVQAACAAITALINKAGSRKFLVLIIATHAMYISLLPPEYWTMIVMAWQGVHGGRQIVAEYRGNHQVDGYPSSIPVAPNDERYTNDTNIRAIEGVAVQ